MDYWNQISGTVLVKLTSAQPEQTLNSILKEQIPVSEVSWIDELTCQFTVRRKDLIRLEQLFRHTGNNVEVLKQKGIFRYVRSFLDRPVLLSVAVLLLILSMILPTRILFIRTEGNRNLPAAQILTAAEDCGIRFGASRKQVRSEKVKNALLSRLPQLQWAGINTQGCTAVISVRERQEQPKESNTGFSNLLATQDGYILSQVVTSGTPLVSPGTSVIQGQVLISGYTDCGICIRAGRAEGEILAQTRRELTAVTPISVRTVRKITDRSYKVSLLLRKKRINLWKDSRISDTDCGRMYEEYFVSLPGGFQLPIALCIDQYLHYDTEETSITESEALERLQHFSDDYLLHQTVGGQILKKEQHFRNENGIYRFFCHYTCTEFIGTEKEEQIGEINEQGS